MSVTTTKLKKNRNVMKVIHTKMYNNGGKASLEKFKDYYK